MYKIYKEITRGLVRGTDMVLETNIVTGAKTIAQSGKAGLDGDILREHITPRPKLVLCGAGHLSKSLCPLADKLGFDVVVVDNRTEFSNKARFSRAKTLWCAPLDVALDNVPHTENTYFAVLTRDYGSAADCLQRILAGDYAYVGLVGTAEDNEPLFSRLVKNGVNANKISDIVAPIGIDIGAVTTREMAVSILAQLIAKRAERGVGVSIDREVLTALGSGKARVLATLIEKNGHLPNGVGSKLVLMNDGSYIGTVGGGKAEAAVRKEAAKMRPDSAPKLMKMDMSADVSRQSEGKVSVLIECVGPIKDDEEQI